VEGGVLSFEKARRGPKEKKKRAAGGVLMAGPEETSGGGKGQRGPDLASRSKGRVPSGLRGQLGGPRKDLEGKEGCGRKGGVLPKEVRGFRPLAKRMRYSLKKKSRGGLGKNKTGPMRGGSHSGKPSLRGGK